MFKIMPSFILQTVSSIKIGHKTKKRVIIWPRPIALITRTMVATGQEMVREKENSSRSGKCQGILFWVRENWHFEEKSGKIEIVRLI